MTRPPLLCLLVGLMVFTTVGCGTDPTELPADGVVSDQANPPSDQGTTTGMDIVVENPVFELGYNEQGKVTPDHFFAAQDGMEAPIVKGSQGAWMLVVAARSNQWPDVDKVNVEAEIGPAGQPVFGKLKYKKRPLLDGGDGFKYLMNVFLVVSNDQAWDGQLADFTVILETTDGTRRLEATTSITLVKTDPN